MSFTRRSTPNTLSGVRFGLVPTTPSGIPQLDPLLGGGLPLGVTLLLAEDAHNVYGRQLMKAFVAEGIVHGHRILVVDGETPLKLEELPRKVDKEQSKTRQDSRSPAESMKIAFRYERLPEHESLPEGHADHVLDFGLSIESDELKKADIVRCNALTQSPEEILRIVSSSIAKDKVLRIVATVGLLLDHGFLRRLKVLARHENVVCWISAPACLEDESFHRLFATADSVLSLVAFSSAERQANPLYKKFHGLLSLDKLAEINSVTGSRPASIEYTFHQSGRRFAIEQLHMPPDLGNPDGPIPVTMSCQTSGGGRAMDF